MNFSAPHKICIRETSLFTSAISNQVHNGQTILSVTVPGQNQGGEVYNIRQIVWHCRTGRAGIM